MAQPPRRPRRTVRSPRRTTRIDPILLEILWTRLLSSVQEEAVTLIRAAFSTIVRENEDLSCGIFDAEGNMMVQSVTGTPGHINSLAAGIRHFLRRYPPEGLDPGDTLITNDPWFVAGHKFDMTVVSPIFHRRTFVGLTGSTCHVVDIGGRGLTAETRDVYEEGLEIPIMKVVKKGTPNDDLFEIIRTNVRSPDLVIGDIRAQIAASEMAALKVSEFMDEYGLDSLLPVSKAICDTSEQAMRRAIGALPDGTFRHEITLDGFEEPIVIRCAVIIDGTQVTVDYTGTSPQSPRGINVVRNYTHAYTTYAIKASVCPEVPNNEGSFRPVRLVVPEGCILNAVFPAPVQARHLTGHFTSPAVWGALAQVIPDRVIAESSSNCLSQFVGRDRQGRHFVASYFSNGGMGARPTKDGLCTSACPTNVGNSPVEVIENVFPLWINYRRLVPDSGGPGIFRGGVAQEISARVLTDDPCDLFCLYERVKNPALGYAGGAPGMLCEFSVRTPDGRTDHPHPKMRYTVVPGSEIDLRLAGGGGFFDPYERDPERVLADANNGLVTVEGARRDYGVVVDLTRRRVDAEATRRLRASRGSAAAS